MINFEKLNDMQKKAVLQTEGSVLILAGAGSGKTGALTVRISHIIESGVAPWNILAITFTNKAAKEMQERVNNLIGEKSKDVWISTFHSICVRILRRDIDKIEYNNNFSIYDTDDQEKLMKQVFKKLNYNNDKSFSIKGVLNEISRQKDELISPEEYAQNSDKDFKRTKIANAYKVYQNLLKENNALDFDDIIYKTVQLFNSNEDVLNYYQEKFKYIMVDEYQDTNSSQYELIKMLSQKYKNICVVGDDDQSIYGWRGANIRNILDFEKDFPNTMVIKLEQNYRSTKNILDVANNVILNNIERKEKNLWTENDYGNIINLYKANDEKDEAYFVYNTINKIVQQENIKYKNFAILYRANAQSRVIEDLLFKNNMPYRIFSGVRFYDRKEIKDIISYLKVIQNPYDTIAFKRIINVPKRGIGDISIERLENFSYQNNISIFDAIEYIHNIPELKQRAKSFKEFYNILSDIRKNVLEQEKAIELNEIFNKTKYITVSQIITDVINKTGYLKDLINEGSDEALSRIDNINEFISKAVEYENENDIPSLRGFLEEVSLIANIDSYDNNNDYITLMTLHTSKGLEFPYVFMIGMEENIFPSYNAITYGGIKSIEEERRLCYVGITRAKKQLFLSYSNHRLQNGMSTNNPPSRFLKEIPEEFLDNPIKIKVYQNSSISKLNNSLNYSKQTLFKNNYNSFINKNNIPSPKDIKLDYVVGDKVRAPKWGIGTVKSINPGGADFEVEVDFLEKGVKKFMASLSKLKKVAE